MSTTPERALIHARRQFEQYAEGHAAKAAHYDAAKLPGSAEGYRIKAKANRAMATMMTEALEGSGSTLLVAMMHVRQFHDAFAPDLIADKPRPLSMVQVQRRRGWMDSETAEIERDTPTDMDILEGLDDGAPIDRIDVMAKQVDGFLDAIYFALGGVMEMGLDPSPLWDIVHHEGNMTKRHMIDGVPTVVRRPGDNKVVKPEGWVDPHAALYREIERQVSERERFGPREFGAIAAEIVAEAATRVERPDLSGWEKVILDHLLHSEPLLLTDITVEGGRMTGFDWASKANAAEALTRDGLIEACYPDATPGESGLQHWRLTAKGREYAAARS